MVPPLGAGESSLRIETPSGLLRSDIYPDNEDELLQSSYYEHIQKSFY